MSRFSKENAIIYDLFPETIGPAFKDIMNGLLPDQYVLITSDGRQIFMDEHAKDGMEYYGTALVGNGMGSYSEFNAYTAGTSNIKVPQQIDHSMNRDSWCNCYKSDDRLNELDEAFRRSIDFGWSTDMVDDKETINKYNLVNDAITEIKSLLDELSVILQYYVDKNNGDNNKLLVPILSESAAEYFYNRLFDLYNKMMLELKE